MYICNLQILTYHISSQKISEFADSKLVEFPVYKTVVQFAMMSQA